MVAFHSVFFNVDDGEPKYNPATGKYDKPSSTQIEKNCYVYDLASSRKLELYGRMNVRGLVIYHMGSLVPDAVTVEIKTGPFKGRFYINDRRQVMQKATYVVSEVKLDGR